MKSRLREVELSVVFTAGEGVCNMLSLLAESLAQSLLIAVMEIDSEKKAINRAERNTNVYTVIAALLVQAHDLTAPLSFPLKLHMFFILLHMLLLVLHITLC